MCSISLARDEHVVVVGAGAADEYPVKHHWRVVEATHADDQMLCALSSRRGLSFARLVCAGCLSCRTTRGGGGCQVAALLVLPPAVGLLGAVTFSCRLRLNTNCSLASFACSLQSMVVRSRLLLC
jgi:hypothetical protein